MIRKCFRFFIKLIKGFPSASYQIKGMLKTLKVFDKFKYLFYCLLNTKSIIASDRLLHVDSVFAKHIDILQFKMNNKKLLVPFKKMEKILNRQGNDNASLELIRELFGNNEYLRKFKKNLQADVILDIGSNRGYFALLAGKVLNSKKIICIEPQNNLTTIRHLLAKENSIALDFLIEYSQFCSAENTDNCISINKILQENDIKTIDLLKMDVEGAEADIFSKNTEWLNCCKNITMEIHFNMGNVKNIPTLLESKGFKTILTDLRGNPINKQQIATLSRGCAYLQASSNNDLLI
ncbi:MAG: FkbM family methyltransferase [Chlamydiae bacterium]|nr:FkbM family methyltransferase [Chlamydiota bacterium]